MAKDKTTYNDFSKEELLEQIEKEQQTLQHMRMNHAVSPLENPMKIRETRRNIARLKTELQKRKSDK